MSTKGTDQLGNRLVTFSLIANQRSGIPVPEMVTPGSSANNPKVWAVSSYSWYIQLKSEVQQKPDGYQEHRNYNLAS